MACVGIYGVVNYMVAQRVPEMGIRMALGARRADVVILVLAKGMRLASFGVLAGVAGAMGTTRLMRSLLFQVNPADPWIMAGVSGLLIAVTFIACWFPARRAASVDPLQALRAE
jgi:ABC-type antimicrobial peptide transport system permease subunit